MRWSRRKFLAVGGLSAMAAALTREAQAGMFIMKRLFALPPRETLPVTPNKDFYIVNYDGVPTIPVADLLLGKWTLSMHGAVKKPFTLTYQEIQKRPLIEQIVTLECIENPVGGGSISNARWGGISLKALLEEAQPLPSAYKAVFHASDGYADSFSFERAMRGDVLLAYLMNGEQLPPDHGFPLRVVVPGIYGIKNVKWLTEIELTEFDFKGYWQQRGWADDAPILTTSRIDDPGLYQEIKGDHYTVRGIAFGGAHGVKEVEISTDGGRTWNQADMDPPLSPFSWVLWSYPWRIPKPDVYTLIVRATDGRGLLQSSEIATAYPKGPSGFHYVVVDVVKA
jgi:DMSO/TMAO reductase YedYZ molybdopterin-dependent catalytic subunit